MAEAKPDAKVLFRVPNDDGTAEVETLWATSLGGDRYQLDNCPFYAHSVSWEDIVLAPWSEEEGFPAFERVVEKSGNRSVRVFFKPPVEAGNESDRILQGLVDRGCGYEGATHSYVVINIPPGVEFEAITAWLVDCDANWEYADPSYDDLFLEAETLNAPKQSLPRVLGEIVFLIAMSIGITLGVPKGLALLLPAGFCAAAPVSETVFIMGIVVWILIALPKKKSGLRPLLRFGAVMLAGTILAHLAARLVVGCTPLAGWDEHVHSAVAIFVVLVIFTPLAYLHREIIEPRWSRAMGEGGEGEGAEGEE